MNQNKSRPFSASKKIHNEPLHKNKHKKTPADDIPYKKALVEDDGDDEEEDEEPYKKAPVDDEPASFGELGDFLKDEELDDGILEGY